MSKRSRIALLILVSWLVVFVPVPAAQEAEPEPAAEPAAEAEPDPDPDKVLYALGLALAQRIAVFGFTPEEVEKIQAGVADGALKQEPQVELMEYGPKIDGYLKQRMEASTAQSKADGAIFVEKMAAEDGATRSDTGMVFFDLGAGDGFAPGPADEVQIHYTGTFIDGEVFDTSRDGEPATFRLNGVIPCFSEGLQKMQVGGKAKLVCPAEIAYGDAGFPPSIPPGTTIVFEVELLDVPSQSPATSEQGEGESTP